MGTTRLLSARAILLALALLSLFAPTQAAAQDASSLEASASATDASGPARVSLDAGPADARQGPRLSAERVLLETSLGDVVLALYPEVAPRTTEHMLRLFRLGVFDGTHFPRVERNFVLQVSEATDRLRPLTEEQRGALTTVPLEARADVRHRPLSLSMAHRDGDVNSGSSSFSILVSEAPHLDGQYTVFGEVLAGLDVVEAIRTVSVEGNRPETRVAINRATVFATEAELATRPLRAAPARAQAVEEQPEQAPPGSLTYVILETSAGDMLVELYEDTAPQHAQQFLRLARAGAFNGLEVGRVDHYYIQVFSVAYRRPPANGVQQALLHRLPHENEETHHYQGTLTMAHAEDDAPGASGFTLLLSDGPQFNGGHSPFGIVRRGLEVARALSRVDVDDDHRPRTRIEVRRTRVVHLPAGVEPLVLRGASAPVAEVAAAGRGAWLPVVGELALGLLIWFVSGRWSQRTVGALGLLVVLVGVFAVFVLALPQVGQYRWLGLVLFVGLLGTFRLMSAFEAMPATTPPAKPPAPHREPADAEKSGAEGSSSASK